MDEISAAIGYEDASFFRRLFMHRTGVTPARYRHVFQPIHHAARVTEPASGPPVRTAMKRKISAEWGFLPHSVPIAATSP